MESINLAVRSVADLSVKFISVCSPSLFCLVSSLFFFSPFLLMFCWFDCSFARGHVRDRCCENCELNLVWSLKPFCVFLMKSLNEPLIYCLSAGE